VKKVKIGLAVITVLVFSFFIYLNKNYQVPILMYHSLDESKVGSYAAVEPDVFYNQMKFIKKFGYKVISLPEYCSLLKTKELIPHDLVVITFDDGYRDNLYGIEVLKEFNYPATIFIIANKIGLKEYLLKEDIKEFLETTKVGIGSHTLNEAYLPDTEAKQLKKEIFESKTALEKVFKREIDTFSYSIGGFTEEILGLVKEADYLCACTTNRGFSRKLDQFALRRIKITNRDLGFRLWAKLSGFYNIFKKPKKPY